MTKTEDHKTNPTLDGLMERRTVVLSGEINRDSIAEVGTRLFTLQMRAPDRINLFIDSAGGNMDAALQLCDLITTVITAPVRGVALGACGSAATFVMLYCKERVSTPYSRFLIHSGTRSKISVPINQTTSENLEQLLRDVKATEEMVLQLYMSRLSPAIWSAQRPTDEERRAFVLKLINRGDQNFNDWMSAEEALDVGLVSKIEHGKLDIFPE